MTATIATVPQTIDAALILRAQGIYDTATTGLRAVEHAEVREALAELAAALEFYQSIAAGWVPPEAAYEHLFEVWEYSRRLGLALRLAAEDAMAEADEVVKVLAELGAKGES